MSTKTKKYFDLELFFNIYLKIHMGDNQDKRKHKLKKKHVNNY